MAIKRITLAWISVSDIAQSKKFFNEILGLSVANSADEWGWLELVGKEGGTLLGVGQTNPESGEKPGMNAVVAMTVDDIVASKKEFEDKGVKFISDIIEIPGQVKLATFIDPDGNMFQLAQELQ